MSIGLIRMPRKNNTAVLIRANICAPIYTLANYFNWKIIHS